MTLRPLAGKRIVITRPPHKSEAFAAQLRELGAEPVLVPTIAIQPPADSAPLDAALSHLAQYDWLVVTSANTVTGMWQRFEQLGLDPAGIVWPPVAVVGPATGQALAQRGIQADLMPDEHVAEALFAALKARANLGGARVLLPQGDLARPVLGELLREAGANVDTVIAYTNVQPDYDPTFLTASVDAVTFTSPSTIHNFFEMFDDPLAMIGDAFVVCIGPVTAEPARELGLTVHAIAEPHTVDGMIAALCRAFERNQTS